MKQNLHTHTRHCDGKHTPSEMIEFALAQGFDSLGFSSHSPTVLRDLKCELRDEPAYREEIALLKKQKEGEIEILLGIEADYYTENCIDASIYDYAIAGVHYYRHPSGELMAYDFSTEKTRLYINELYGGDAIKYAKDYYELLSHLGERCPYASFFAHVDLLTKFSERDTTLIDEQNAEYRKAALSAVESLIKTSEFFEVNTGAISRGYRTTPYPAPFLLRGMRDMGCKFLLSSDCHNGNFLDCHFNESKQLLLANGIDTLYFLKGGQFVGEKIK